MTNKNVAMMRIVKRFCDDFPIQLNHLIERVSSSDDPEDSPENTLSFVHNEVHRLAGTAHCMGFKALGKEFDYLEKEMTAAVSDPSKSMDATISDLLPRLEQIASYSSDILPSNSKLLTRSRALEELLEAEDTLSRPTDIDCSRRRMLNRERVLFADDDQHIRELVGSTLTNAGVEHIHLAANGQEVLDAIDSFQPTLILTDWLMQPVSGLSLLKSIRKGQTSLHKETPVIFFTSLKTRHDIMKANRYGVNRLIAKPILPPAIIDIILNVLERKFHIRDRLEKMN